MNDEVKKVVRHQLFDRIVHWLFACTILTLLLTGLLPVFGIKFEWVTIHWVAGVVLFALLAVHSVRALLFKGKIPSRGSMWLSVKDFKIALSGLKSTAGDDGKPGKYSLAQKAMHLCVTLLVLVAVGTGLLLMVKIDTPFWQRNPYWLEQSTWGVIYVLHGLVALAFVSVIMMHFYFSLRPEKRMYLRSIFLGWISEKEYRQNHNSGSWPQ